MKWQHIALIGLLAALIYTVRPASTGSAAVQSLGDATAAVAVAGL